MAFDDFSQPTRPQPEHQNPFASPLSGGEESANFEPAFLGERLNPWLSIWTRPRATIRQIVETNPTQGVILLAAVAGVVNALDSLTEIPDINFGTVLISALLLGSIGGIIGWFIISALVTLASGWLGGVANAVQVRCAYAWGSGVPAVWLLPIAVPIAYLTRNDAAAINASPSLAIVTIVLGVVAMVLGIWSLFVLCKCIGEVNQFSAWRALGAMILGVLVVAVPVMVIFFAVLAMTV